MILTRLFTVFVFVSLCFSTNAFSNDSKSLWSGEITGMAKGKFQLTITDISGSPEEQSVKGKLYIDVESRGVNLDCSVKGKVKSGLLKLKFSSWVDGALVKGVFFGTLSETQGLGSWVTDVFDEEGGRFAGEWVMEKQ